MTYSQFSKLINMLTPYLKKQDTKMKKAVPINKKITFVLRRLGFRNHISKSGNYLGLFPASTSKFTHEVCKVFVTHFNKEYIQDSEGKELEEIMNGFEALSGVPYMWVAIDGNHILLFRKPSIKQVPTNYHNFI